MKTESRGHDRRPEEKTARTDSETGGPVGLPLACWCRSLTSLRLGATPAAMLPVLAVYPDCHAVLICG